MTVRQSIRATYDSRETGPRFHVTFQVNDHTITFQEPVADPFVRGTVTVRFRDLLRALVTRRKLTVTVIVGGHPDVVNDVLELDANALVPNSTRRQVFDSHVNERLEAFGEQELFDRQGEDDAEVWVPPRNDCMEHRPDKPCPHCGGLMFHHRTRRCGDCGRRP